MENRFKSVRELIDGKYKFLIPYYQRGYRWGEKEVKALLDDLYQFYCKNKNTNKYYFLQPLVVKKDENQYRVVDGQQRLTTLFLIYWYLAKRDNKDKIELIYETRVSAKEFCEKIWNFEIDFGKKISTQIKNSKDFSYYFKYDLTVKSMLTMLDEIQQRMKNHITLKDLEKITFEIFELEDFSGIEAEEFYQKINSRGKVLSFFDNFKSIALDVVLNKYKDKYKEIAKKFEDKWIEYFWNDDVEKIEDYMINYILFIIEIKSYENGELEFDVKDFKFIKKFLESNLEFLESSLDVVKKLNDALSNIDIKLFSEENIETIFEKIKKGENVSLENKFLLYLVIIALIKNKNIDFIKDLVRVARNVLHRNRALRTSSIIYSVTIDKKDMKSYIEDFNEILESKNVYEALKESPKKRLKHEKEKADLILNGLQKEIFELEDYKHLKGDLRILKSIVDNISWKDLHDMIINKKIFEKNNFLRALLSISVTYSIEDDYSLKIGSVYHGDKYFFGDKEHLEIFFTFNEKSKEKIEIYKKFFEKVIEEIKSKSLEDSLQNLIDEALNKYECENKNWLYYFIKYPSILEDTKELKNIFGWFNLWLEKNNHNSVYVEKMEKESRISYKHYNVYLFALIKDKMKQKINFNNKLEILWNKQSKLEEYINSVKINDWEISLYKDKFILKDGNEVKEVSLFKKQDAIEDVCKIITRL